MISAIKYFAEFVFYLPILVVTET